MLQKRVSLCSSKILRRQTLTVSPALYTGLPLYMSNNTVTAFDLLPELGMDVSAGRLHRL